MVAVNRSTFPLSEDVVAELASAAYGGALRHGLRAPFIDVELELWQALRSVLGDLAADPPEIVG